MPAFSVEQQASPPEPQEISASQTATFTAPDKPGSYPSICSIPPPMKGTLTVG